MLAGENKIVKENMKEMLEQEKNIYNYMTVPANGLYLMEVNY